MNYKSTRDSSLNVTSAVAIAQGISADGGLFIPESVPQITMDELKALCVWTWTTQGGKDGYLVKGRNGNSIFLPAAGRRSGAGLDDVGSEGNYWTSSLANAREAYSFVFQSYYIMEGMSQRYLGLSVRPVRE